MYSLPKCLIHNVFNYPFAITLESRTFSSESYRYGFQGQERDDEIKGEGNSWNYSFRMHDPRLGRFFAIDPLSKNFPWNSTYAFSENSVINAVELEGLELVFTFNSKTMSDAVKGQLKAYSAGDITYDQLITFIENHPNHLNWDSEENKAWAKKQLEKAGNELYSTSSERTFRPISSNHSSSNRYVQFRLIEETEKGWERTTVTVRGSGYNDPQGQAYPTGLGIPAHWWDEGGDDSGNTGGRLGGEHGWQNGGKQLFFGTIGLITAPFTIAAGGAYAVVGTISLANSADDMAGVMTNDEGKSLLQQLTTDTKYEKFVSGMKVGATFVTTIGGAAQLWKMGVDAPTLIGTANDVRSLVDTYIQK